MRLLFSAIALISSSTAFSQEDPTVTSNITVVSTVPDVAKLEARAIAILRSTYYKKTLAEARELVRTDGKLDIARCVEYLIHDALQKITQISVVEKTVENPRLLQSAPAQ